MLSRALAMLWMVVMILTFTVPVAAQEETGGGASILIGAAGGAMFVMEGGKVTSLSDVLAEVGIAFPINTRQSGELIALGGQQSGDSETGGILYRHMYDAIQNNPVKIGLTVGGFVLGRNASADINETSLYFGGGPCVVINNDPTNPGDRVVGFMEVYKPVAGSEAVVARLGMAGSF